MNFPMFRFELNRNSTYTIIWCVGLVFSTGANVAGNASGLTPATQVDILTVFAQSAVNMVMMGSIFSMILGGLVISREEDEKTIEFLLSHPVTRMETALSKFAAYFVLFAALNLVLLIADIVFLEIFKTDAGYDFGGFFGIWLSEVALMFFFGAAGLLLSAFLTKGGAVVGTCIGIPLITVILMALGGVDNALLRYLSYLSPYRYLDVGAIISRGGAQPAFLAAMFAIAVAFIVVTFARYSRREFAA